MADQWYIARNKQRHGPYSTEQLQQFVQPTDMVMKEGTGKWVAASTVFLPSPSPAGSDGAKFSHSWLDRQIQSVRALYLVAGMALLWFISVFAIGSLIGVLLMAAVCLGFGAYSIIGLSLSQQSATKKQAGILLAGVLAMSALTCFGIVGLVSNSSSDMERQIESSIKAEFLAKHNVMVTKVTLVKKSKNEYTGLAETMKGQKIALVVTVDGEKYIWKTDGTFTLE